MIIPLFRPFYSIIEDRSVGQPQEVHIRKLQEFYWSDADPDGRAFVPLADALRQIGDFREAHRLLRDGLGRHPDFLSGHVVAAWLSLDRGSPEEAEARFRTALELDPRNISALRGLAEILLDRGEASTALAFLQDLSHEDPLDLDLPNRILALRAEVEAAADVGPESEREPKPSVWDDPEAVARELNWDGAALQPDSSPGASLEAPEELAPPASVVEDGEPLPAPEDLEEALVTSTLGEIYLRQGLFGRAERVFLTLLHGDPENQHLQHRLEEVQSLLQGREVDGGEERDVFEEGVVTIESLAPDEVGEAPGGEDVAEEPVSIGDLAPIDVVPIEALAPDRTGSVFFDAPISIEALAPAPVVSIAALAPDEPSPSDMYAPDGPVSIEALAPDEPVSIEALAPDEPVSIEALAPDGPVTIESLAPEPPAEQSTGGLAEGQGPGSDPTIDAFESWLDKLK